MKVDLPASVIRHVTVLLKDERKSYSELGEVALKKAFAEHPDAFGADDIRYARIWLNEGGIPVGMIRVTVKLSMPVPVVATP